MLFFPLLRPAFSPLSCIATVCFHGVNIIQQYPTSMYENISIQVPTSCNSDLWPPRSFRTMTAMPHLQDLRIIGAGLSKGKAPPGNDKLDRVPCKGPQIVCISLPEPTLFIELVKLLPSVLDTMKLFEGPEVSKDLVSLI